MTHVSSIWGKEIGLFGTDANVEEVVPMCMRPTAWRHVGGGALIQDNNQEHRGGGKKTGIF